MRYQKQYPKFYCSAEVLSKLGIDNVNSIGCHAFFINNKKKIAKKDVLSVRNVITNGGLLPDNKINKGLLFSYILQCQNEDQSLFIKTQKQKPRLIDFNSLSDLRYLSLFKREAIYFPKTISEWVKVVRKYDFSIGGRVHRAIIALNNGVPTLLTNGDLRSREMSEIFCILQDYTLDHTVDVRAAYEETDFTNLNKNFPILYQKFVEFARKNDVQIY